MYRVYPYKLGSRSASVLAEHLRESGHRAFKVRPDGRYRYRPNHIVINWGSALKPAWDNGGVYYLNHPDNVAIASNKRLTFEAFSQGDVPTVDWTEDRETAASWLENGHTVIARKLLRASAGRGVVAVEPGDNLVNAPLYTKYLKKKYEYRIHVFNKEVIDVQQKRKERGENVDTKIRNHSNGWVFCRNDIDEPPAAVLKAAVDAVDSLGLLFGAVDIIYNQHYDRAAVLEVNTAPGLEGSTVHSYVRAITNIL